MLLLESLPPPHPVVPRMSLPLRMNQFHNLLLASLFQDLSFDLLFPQGAGWGQQPRARPHRRTDLVHIRACCRVPPFALKPTTRTPTHLQPTEWFAVLPIRVDQNGVQGIRFTPLVHDTFA